MNQDQGSDASVSTNTGVNTVENVDQNVSVNKIASKDEVEEVIVDAVLVSNKVEVSPNSDNTSTVASPSKVDTGLTQRNVAAVDQQTYDKPKWQATKVKPKRDWAKLAKDDGCDDVEEWGESGCGQDDDLPVKAVVVSTTIGPNGEVIEVLGEEEEDEDAKKEGFWASVWNLGVSLPGLVGTWCWPLLLAWIFMIAWYNVPIGLSKLFYALELAMMSVLVTNMFQYAHWLNKRRRKKDDNAVRLIGWSIPVNLAYPLVVCIIYIGGYGYPEWKLWTDGSFFPNTNFGIFMWCVKYAGFLMLTVGIVRITGMWKKTKKRWNDIRSGKFKKKQEAKKAAAAGTDKTAADQKV